MTSFFSPERPRLANGNPCWLGVQVALPGLYITPQPLDGPHDPPWLTVELLLDGSWTRTTLEPSSLLLLLADWRADPELALKLWFAASPPAVRKPPALPVAEDCGAIIASAEDLDL